MEYAFVMWYCGHFPTKTWSLQQNGGIALSIAMEGSYGLQENEGIA
jgi:hypothetical protein